MLLQQAAEESSRRREPGGAGRTPPVVSAAGAAVVSTAADAAKRSRKKISRHKHSDVDDGQWNIPSYLQHVVSTTARSVSEASTCREEELHTLEYSVIDIQLPDSPACVGVNHPQDKNKFSSTVRAFAARSLARDRPSAAPPSRGVASDCAPTTAASAASAAHAQSSDTVFTAGDDRKTFVPVYSSLGRGALTGDPFSRPPLVPVRVLMQESASSSQCVSGTAAAATGLSVASVSVNPRPAAVAAERVTSSAAGSHAALAAAGESSPIPFACEQREPYFCRSSPSSKATATASAAKQRACASAHLRTLSQIESSGQFSADDVKPGETSAMPLHVSPIRGQRERAAPAAMKDRAEEQNYQHRWPHRCLRVVQEKQREMEVEKEQKVPVRSPAHMCRATGQRHHEVKTSCGPVCDHTVASAQGAACLAAETVVADALEQNARRENGDSKEARTRASPRNAAYLDNTPATSTSCAAATRRKWGLWQRVRDSPKRKIHTHSAETIAGLETQQKTSHSSACHYISERQQLSPMNQRHQLHLSKQNPCSLQAQRTQNLQPQSPNQMNLQVPLVPTQQQQQHFPSSRQQASFSTAHPHGSGCSGQKTRVATLKQQQIDRLDSSPTSCCTTSMHFCRSSSQVGSPSRKGGFLGRAKSFPSNSGICCSYNHCNQSSAVAPHSTAAHACSSLRVQESSGGTESPSFNARGNALLHQIRSQCASPSHCPSSTPLRRSCGLRPGPISTKCCSSSSTTATDTFNSIRPFYPATAAPKPSYPVHSAPAGEVNGCPPSAANALNTQCQPVSHSSSAPALRQCDFSSTGATPAAVLRGPRSPPAAAGHKTQCSPPSRKTCGSPAASGAACQHYAQWNSPSLRDTGCRAFASPSASPAPAFAAHQQSTCTASACNSAAVVAQRADPPFLEGRLHPHECSPGHTSQGFGGRDIRSGGSPLQQDSIVPTGLQPATDGHVSTSAAAGDDALHVQTKKVRSKRAARRKNMRTVAFAGPASPAPQQQLRTPLQGRQEHQHELQPTFQKEELQNIHSPACGSRQQQPKEKTKEQPQDRESPVFNQHQRDAEKGVCTTASHKTPCRKDVDGHTHRSGLRWLKWKKRNGSKSPEDVNLLR